MDKFAVLSISMEEKLDYIIVGQGLAGSILSFNALKRGKKIKVIASDDFEASSKVAAGIINSVVLKRLTKSWRADEFNSYLRKFYPQLEDFLNLHFFEPTNTLKLISSEEEEKYWLSRRIKNELSAYLSDEIHNSKLSKFFNFQKSGEIFQTFLLDVVPLLEHYLSKIREKGLFINENFDYLKLQSIDNKIKYKNLTADYLVFAEGFHTISNPFFNWLPFTLNKGEILNIKTEQLDINSVVNKGIFILPLGKTSYKIGSTFEWEKLDKKPTEEKRNEIIKKFEEMSAAKVDVVGQVAGIRPATKDRRPFLGKHPKYQNVYIFNGMGSKAGLMAPLLSHELLEHIEYGKKLHKESSIERFKNLYQVDSLK